jgi:UDP-2-acetamido-3-amino-2,3-dideoxy-glucuronate N-acetyltransferase
MRDKCIAVIGAGKWGTNLVRTFQELGALHTVCDASSQCRDKINKQYGVEAVDELDFVSCNRSIRGVVIAVPNTQHYTLARAALLAGKDVLVEKPLAVSSTEAQDLVRIAYANDRLLMVGHLLLYQRQMQELKSRLPELGRLQYIESCRTNPTGFRTDDNVIWRLLPHDVATALYLLGGSHVTVIGARCDMQAGVVANVDVDMLVWQTPVFMHASWLLPKRIREFRAKGELESAFITEDPDENVLRTECQDFLSCMETRRQPVANGKLGMEVVKVLEEIERISKVVAAA